MWNFTKVGCLVVCLFFIFNNKLISQSTYYWVGGNSGVWSNVANWNTDPMGNGTQRIVADTNDILIFDAVTATVNIDAGTKQKIGQLLFKNNANVTLRSNTTTRDTIVIRGGKKIAGNDFEVGASCTLNLTDLTNPVLITFSDTDNIGVIDGVIDIRAGAQAANGINTTSGTNTIVTVNGTFNNGTSSTGYTAVISSANTLIFNNASVYNHKFATFGGTIPTAKWSKGSLVNLTGYTSSSGIPYGIGQTFSNFTWNCPNQANLISFNTTFTCLDTFKLVAGSLSLATGNYATGTFILGNYIQSGGYLDIGLASNVAIHGYGGSTAFIDSGVFILSKGVFQAYYQQDIVSSYVKFCGKSGVQNITISNNATLGSAFNLVIDNDAGINLTGTMTFGAKTTVSVYSTARNPVFGSGKIVYSSGSLYYVTSRGNQWINDMLLPAVSGPSWVGINNTSPAPNNIVNIATSVAATPAWLDMYAGVLMLNNTDLVINGTFRGMNAFGLNNMIVTNGTGQLKVLYNNVASFTFPLGDTVGIRQYSPITINLTATSKARTIGIRVIDSVPPNIGSSANYLTRYWRITENGGGGTYSYKPTFGYANNAEDINGAAANILVGCYNNSFWNDFSGTSANGILTGTSSNMNQFSAPLNGAILTGRSTLQGLNYTWTGSVSSDWLDPNNWNPMGFPNSELANAQINFVNNFLPDIKNSYLINVKKLIINNNNINVNSKGSLITNDSVLINNNGTIVLNDTTSLIANGGPFIIDTGSKLILSKKANVNFNVNVLDSGAIIMSNNSSLTMSGTNNLKIYGSLTTNDYSTITPGNTYNYGVFAMNNYSISTFGINSDFYNYGTINQNDSSILILSKSYNNSTPNSHKLYGKSVLQFNNSITPNTLVGTLDNSATSTIVLNQTNAQNIPALTNGYGNLYLTGGATYSFVNNVNIQGKLRQVGGSLKISTGVLPDTVTVAGDYEFPSGALSMIGDKNMIGASILNIGGSITGITGAILMESPANDATGNTGSQKGSSIINIAGDINFIRFGNGGGGGSVNFGAGIYNAGNRINIGGNFNASSGTSDYSYTPGQSDADGFVFNGKKPQTINNAFCCFGAGFRNITFQVAQGSTFILPNLNYTSNGANANVHTRFIVNPGGILDANSSSFLPGVNGSGGSGYYFQFLLDSGATLRTSHPLGIAGLFGFSQGVNGNVFTFHDKANYEFYGNNNVPATNFFNTTMNRLLVTNANANGIALNANITVDTVIVSAPSTLDAATYIAAGAGMGQPYAQIDGKFKTANLKGFWNGIATALTSGFQPPVLGVNSIIYYTGAAGAKQIVTGYTYPNINISGGNGKKILDGDVNVVNTLTFSPNILITNNKFLTMQGRNKIKNFSSTAYIATYDTLNQIPSLKGGLKINNISGAAADTFPVGPTPYSYNPIIFSNSGTADNFTVRVDTCIGSCLSNTNGTYMVKKIWHIGEDVPGGSLATITPQWNTADQGANFSRAQCFVFHHDGNRIDQTGATGAATGLNPYTRGGGGFASFSPFSVGSNLPLLPLADLLSFNVKKQGNSAQLIWAVSKDNKMIKFEIQRSANGQLFNTISTLNAINNQENYIGFDNNLLIGVNYYRLKVTEKNGDVFYSKVLIISNQNQGVKILGMAPTLVIERSVMTIQISKLNQIRLEIGDMTGKKIMNFNNMVNEGINEIQLNLQQLSTGAYVLNVYDNNGNYLDRVRFIKQ